jgi:hypothetical protein
MHRKKLIFFVAADAAADATAVAAAYHFAGVGPMPASRPRSAWRATPCCLPTQLSWQR